MAERFDHDPIRVSFTTISCSRFAPALALSVTSLSGVWLRR